jgi:hypothetical protein
MRRHPGDLVFPMVAIDDVDDDLWFILGTLRWRLQPSSSRYPTDASAHTFHKSRTWLTQTGRVQPPYSLHPGV